MKTLFIVHCGYYEELNETRFEMHVNLPVVAESLEEAKSNVKLYSDFKRKHMHIDGIQELKQVAADGIKWSIQCIPAE